MPSTNRKNSWEDKTLYHLRRMHIDTESLASAVSGEAINVNVVGGGTSGTQYPTGTVPGASTTMTAAGVVRKDATGALDGDGEYTLLQVDSTGALKVTGSGGGGGDASADNQLTQIDIASNMLTNLIDIISKTPALGEATTDASVPVVLASNHPLLQTNIAEPLPTGGNVIGEVLITNVGPGTDATSLGKLSNALYDEGTDVGVAMWGITPTNLYAPLRLDANGKLLTNLVAGGSTQYTSNISIFAPDATDGVVTAAGAVYDYEGNTALVDTNLAYTPLAVDRIGSLRVSAPEGYASAVGVNSSTDDVGGATTITATMSAGAATVTVTDTTLFPSPSGVIMVGSLLGTFEYMSYTGNGGGAPGVLTGLTRGLYGTSDVEHASGSAVAGVFVGEWELSPFPDVMVSLKAGTNQTGTEYFDFSNDGGTTVDTFPVSGFEVGASHEFHTAVKGSRYFRVRYISSSSSIATDFRVYTYYGQFRAGNLPLNQSISNDADSTIVRAVQTGEDPQNQFDNVKRDGSAFRTAVDAILGGGLLVSDVFTTNLVIRTNIGSGSITDFANNGYLYLSTAANQNVGGEYVQYSNYSEVAAPIYDFNLTNLDYRGVFGSAVSNHLVTDSTIVGEAYVGTFEGNEILNLQGFTQVQTQILSSNNGIGNFQWFTDSAGTNTIRTLAPPYRTPGQYDFLAAPSFGPYVRYVFANVDSTSTTNFYFETLFLTKSLSAQVLTVDSTILPQMTANLTRSVIAGQLPGGAFENVSIGTQNDLQVSLANPTAAFGELSSVTLQPVAQLKFVYGLLASEIQTFVNSGTEVEVNVEGSASTCLSQTIYLPGGDVFTNSGTGDYFTITDASNISSNVWYDVNNLNSAPSIGAYEIDILSNYTPTEVATATSDMFVSCLSSNFSVSTYENLFFTNTTSTGSVSRSIDASNMPTNFNTNLLIASTPGTALATVGNGPGIAAYGVLRGRRQVRYQAGAGNIFRWTTIFDTPAAGVDQFMGLGNSTNGLYIGYSGTEFMVSRRYGGKHIIGYLTITDVTLATTGTVIVTVDGIDHEVTISNIASEQEVANDIANHNYLWGLYNVDVVDDTVIFLNQRVTNNVPKTFAFNLGTATNITAIFETTGTGQQVSQDNIIQANFNIDKLDGNGPSGMTIDPQKGNVYQLQYQWLGFGKIIFSVSNPDTGFFTPFHRISYANQNITPSLLQPDMQITAFVTATGSVTQKTLKMASAAAFTEGTIIAFDPRLSDANTHSLGSDTNLTERAILAFYNPRTFNGITNQVQMQLTSLSVTSTSTSGNFPKARTTFYIAVADDTIDTNIVFDYVEPDDGNNIRISPVAVAKPTVANNYLPATTTAPRKILSVSVPADGSQVIDLRDKNIIIFKNSLVYILYSTPVTHDSIDISVDLNWVEGQ